MDEATFTDMRKQDNRASYATTQALRYVLGPGARDKAFKDFLKRYFKAAIDVAEKHDGDWKKVDHKSATTEEEEERQAKEYQQRTKERAKQVQKEINGLVLGQLDEKAWEKHEKAFAEFVRKGK